MRSVVNEALVQRRAAAAQRALTLGIALMLAAVALSFNPRWVLVAYALLFVSLFVVNRGTRAAGKWLRSPRVDQMLAKALKGLHGGQRLYSYVLPADHVMLSSTGLFVLLTKAQSGQISCRGDQWRRRLSPGLLIRLLSEERLGNPSKQAHSVTEKVRATIKNHLPDMEVSIEPVVVFVDPTAELDIVEPTVPAVFLQDLKAYLRSAAQGEPMPKGTMKALSDWLDQKVA